VSGSAPLTVKHHRLYGSEWLQAACAAGTQCSCACNWHGSVLQCCHVNIRIDVRGATGGHNEVPAAPQPVRRNPLQYADMSTHPCPLQALGQPPASMASATWTPLRTCLTACKTPLRFCTQGHLGATHCKRRRHGKPDAGQHITQLDLSLLPEIAVEVSAGLVASRIGTWDVGLGCSE
jgi:hypothetical protein